MFIFVAAKAPKKSERDKTYILKDENLKFWSIIKKNEDKTNMSDERDPFKHPYINSTNK